MNGGFIKQRSGIPIGGPVSGIVLDLALSTLERDFDRHTWRRLAATLRLAAGERQKRIACGRYADDTLML